MVKKQRRCIRCGQEITVKQIKVYVFKRRLCKECKTPMFSDNETRYHECKKCGFKVGFDDDAVLGLMGMEMKGTSRDKRVVKAMKRDGFEVVKVYVDARSFCRNCLNMASRMKTMVKQEMKKRGVKELSDEAVKNAILKAVNMKIREEHQKAAEKREKKQELSRQLQKHGIRTHVDKDGMLHLQRKNNKSKKATGLIPTEEEKKRMKKRKKKAKK